jgi:hypothetical protein
VSAPGAIIGRNIRFNVWANGSQCVLTLRPGQTLRHYTAQSTDEGWESEEQFWEHMGDHIAHDFHSDGRDCDGRLERGGRVIAQAIKPSGFPDWEDADTYQRDYSAEAAGY